MSQNLYESVADIDADFIRPIFPDPAVMFDQNTTVANDFNQRLTGKHLIGKVCLPGKLFPESVCAVHPITPFWEYMNLLFRICIDSSEVKTMNRRKYMTAAAASVGMLLLILDSRSALESGQAAMELCARTVIPSLFPFLFLSALITASLWGNSGKLLRSVGWLLQIPEGGESLLLAGFLGGYPAGAVALGDAFRSGCLNRKTAENLLAFCSNAGPAFLFGIVAHQFPDKTMVWHLWGIHMLSAAMVGNLISSPREKAELSGKRNISLSAAMLQTVKTMAMICGWILLFRILIGFLDRWFLWLLPEYLRVLIWGLLELSNGCCALQQIGSVSSRFMIASTMLSFGGICVAMQTASVVSGLSMKGYLTGKLLQTLLSLLLAGMFCCGRGALACILCTLFVILPKCRKKSGSILKLSGV